DFGPFRRRKAHRLVLWLGFGGLLICIVAAAAGTLASLDRVRKAETGIRRAFLGRMGALDQIRSQIYLSGTYVRDFLLSPDPSGATPCSRSPTGFGSPTNAASSTPKPSSPHRPTISVSP